MMIHHGAPSETLVKEGDTEDTEMGRASHQADQHTSPESKLRNPKKDPKAVNNGILQEETELTELMFRNPPLFSPLPPVQNPNV
jgi:hypothetical protein